MILNFPSNNWPHYPRHWLMSPQTQVFHLNPNNINTKKCNNSTNTFTFPFTMDYTLSPFLYAAPLLLAFYIITKHFLRKFHNHPPAPFLTFPIIGHLYLFKKPLQRSLAKISDRYGPVLLLQFGSRKVLLVSSPAGAEECFTKNDVVFANRPHLMAGKHLGYNFTSLAWSSYGDHWRNLRRITSVEMFSTHRLQMLHGIRVDEVKSMVKRINSSAMAEKSVDMKSMFFELMLNVMMRTIAGKRCKLNP